MKFMVVICALVAISQASRVALVNNDGTVTVTGINGQQVTIGKVTPFGVRNVAWANAAAAANSPAAFFQLREQQQQQDVLEQILAQNEGPLNEAAFQTLVQQVANAARAGQVNPGVINLLQALNEDNVDIDEVAQILARQNAISQVAPWASRAAGIGARIGAGRPSLIEIESAQQPLLAAILNGINGQQQQTQNQQQQLLTVALNQLAQEQEQQNQQQQQQLLNVAFNQVAQGQQGKQVQQQTQQQQQLLNAALYNLGQAQQAQQAQQQLNGQQQAQTKVAQQLIAAAINGLASGQQQQLSNQQQQVLNNILGQLWATTTKTSGWTQSKIQQQQIQQQILQQQLQQNVLENAIEALVRGQNTIRVTGNGIPVVVRRNAF